MDSLKDHGAVSKRRRLTMSELREILDKVTATRKNITECFAAPIAETRTRKKICRAKPRKYFSKAAEVGAPEKILALVAMNPEWGTLRLKKSLADQGVSLSRQSIHKILLKHNLNLPVMRKAWQATQKETNT